MSAPGPMGWIPPADRDGAMNAAHEEAMAAALPAFTLDGTYHETTGRFALWQALQKVTGNSTQRLPYNWQVTGSCVGAGGGNMLKTLMAVEIAAGDLEEWKHLWWPFTYGRSRFRAGMRTPGEGSFGSAWAQAIKEDGVLAVDQASNLPEFRVNDGWLQLDRATELRWSDGDAAHVLELASVAKLHLIGSYVRIRNAAEGKAAIANGYPLTQASLFGTRGPQRRGNPVVNIAEWNDRWAHQTYIDEAWDHPTEGLLFRYGNNWGPDAHPAPTQGEPLGGFYITAATFDRICREEEVFAFSAFAGFKVRQLDWLV